MTVRKKKSPAAPPPSKMLKYSFRMTEREFETLLDLRNRLGFNSTFDAVRHAIYRELVAQDMKPSTRLFAVRD